ncbi:MAG: endonuclease/exonuclease/phosphatase family protein [Ilumatobacteraceae bacterium]|nr:endonuclease/exonuclease/phosphatase family protein [Ilumatobacteraceae bacterium]
MDRLHPVWSVAGWTIAVGAALVLLTQPFGTPTATIAALQSLSPWALPPVVTVALIAMFRRRHRLGFVASLVGFGYLVLTAPVAFPAQGPEVSSDAATFTVLASNVLYSNDRIDRAGDVLLGDADIVGLAEITPEQLAILRAHPLAERYAYRLERAGRGARGLMIWSRFPIVEADTGADLDRSLAADVATPDGPVRVVLVHPPPPVFNRPVWQQELDAVPVAVGRSEFPTIVMGDFNANVFHPPFREALDEAGLIDAVPAAGHPLAMTWPTDIWLPPFVALDHILLDGRLAVDHAGVIAVPGADHRAVWATVGFAGSG